MSPAESLPLTEPETRFVASDGSEVARTLHSSGVRILTERVPGAASTAVGFWIPAGSRDEDLGAFGSTHFLEHLLFKGTKDRSALDIATSFDAVGGDHNAMTAKEYTCYHAKVRDRDLPMAVSVLADMITSSVIAADDFETERGVILEELAAADDDPADVAGEKFSAAVFGDHPLARPIGGSEESILGVDRSAVVDHYRQHYLPQELVVTAAGAVHHDSFVDSVLAALAEGGWEMHVSGVPVPRRSAETPRIQSGDAVQTVHRPLEQVSLALGCQTITATDARRPALAVATTILGGGMSSRLFQEVRERRGLAYSIFAFSPGYSDSGMFTIAAGCSARKVPELLAVANAELDRMGRDGATETELTLAVGQLSGSAALALEDSDTRMRRLGRSELTLGEYVDLQTATSRLAAVTLQDVVKVMEEIAAAPRFTVAVGPVKAKDLKAQAD